MKSGSITVQKVQLQLLNSEKQQPDELIRDHQAKHLSWIIHRTSRVISTEYHSYHQYQHTAYCRYNK